MTQPVSIIILASAMLERGDFFGALALVGPRDDPHARAVKGIALAQMGDLAEARHHLLAAEAAFAGEHDTLWLIKVRGALAEIRLAARDFDGALASLDPTPLLTLGDRQSAEYIALQRARLLNLLGRDSEASGILESLTDNPYSPLAAAELLSLRGQFARAYDLLAASRSDNPLYAREMQAFSRELAAEMFIFSENGKSRAMSLLQYEQLETPAVNLVAGTFGETDLLLRPTSAELLAALIDGNVSSETIFGRSSESLENRLRVEISRLRKDLGLTIRHDESGYSLRATGLVTGPYLAVEALMTDGAQWSAAALAMVFGKSKRTVQRALAESDQAQSVRSGRQQAYSLFDRRCSRASQLMVLAQRRKIKTT